MRATHWKVIAIAIFVSILTQKQFGHGPMIAALVVCLLLAWLQRRKMRTLGGNESGCEQSAEFQTLLEPEQAIIKVKEYFHSTAGCLGSDWVSLILDQVM